MEDQEGYVGKCIGNYRITTLIGSGGFGSVYRGEHEVLKERDVAIEILHTYLSTQEERARFLQEARLLEHLQHHHILQIFDAGIDNGLPYLVTEFASHGSLRDLLNRSAHTILPEDVSLRILSQVGEALSYAHQQHIIHRDLKPENILFNANDSALLADFGIAITLSTSSVKYSSVMGTPSYMAPEQFQGTLSQQGDQYALGCIAYELFTGHIPFTAPDFFALGFKHLTDKPVAPTQLNPAVPMHIEQAILKAMAKQRGDRHADVRAFLAALQGPEYAQNSVSFHNIPGLSDAHVHITTGDLTTMPSTHLSQAATFVPVNTPNPDQDSSHSPSQQLATPFLGFDERRTGWPEEIFPTLNAAPPIDGAGYGVPLYQPYQPQQRDSRRRRTILTFACALIAIMIIAPLLFIGLNNFLHTSTSAKTVSIPLTKTSVQSTPSITTHAKSLTALPTHSTTTSGATPIPTSASVNVTSTVPTSQGTPHPTPTAPTPTPTFTPTPTPTQKVPTAETFRVYFDNATSSGLGVSTQHTYSGTVSILVSGYGQANTTQYSDAFYIYTDASGNLLSPPHTSTCWVLYINGSPADSSVGLPNYNSANTYNVSMNLSQPGTINFGICDGQASDNTGYLTVTVQQQ